MVVIEMKNFSKSYGDKVVHKDISFTVDLGECFGLIGGSGQGKSVILRSLIGLERADGGQILLEGRDITHLPEREWVSIRKKIAYAFQDGALFDSMTVYENLAFPLRSHTHLQEKEIHQRIQERLGEFGLLGNEELYPSYLSGGMQKRLGLARATMINPEVVLYDEPTAGLDPYNTKKIEEMILRLKGEKKTSILVTHDMPTAFSVCDRIGLLVNGRLHTILTKEEMKKEGSNAVLEFARGRLR